MMIKVTSPEETAQTLWDSLGDVPVNALDQIEQNWRHFCAGTDREEIWHWFESTYDIPVASRMGFEWHESGSKGSQRLLGEPDSHTMA